MLKSKILRALGYVEVPVVDPITELTNAIQRAMSITKLQSEIRQICEQTIHVIDWFGHCDRLEYIHQADTLPAIEAAPITLRTGEVST
jgi:hypothetical protein